MKPIKKISAATLAAGVVLGGGMSVSAAEVVVEEGDTFWGIAQEYGTDVDDLVAANDEYDPYALPVGATIEVDDSDEEHFVEPGDTLSQIAVDYDTTVDDLTAMNPGVDPYALQPGDGIVVGPGEDGVVDEVEDDDEVAQELEDDVDENDGIIDEDNDGLAD